MQISKYVHIFDKNNSMNLMHYMKANTASTNDTEIALLHQFSVSSSDKVILGSNSLVDGLR